MTPASSSSRTRSCSCSHKLRQARTSRLVQPPVCVRADIVKLMLCMMMAAHASITDTKSILQTFCVIPCKRAVVGHICIWLTWTPKVGKIISNKWPKRATVLHSVGTRSVGSWFQPPLAHPLTRRVVQQAPARRAVRL